ncbi:carbohydrate ABC transporter permease [Paenibacillus mucilaginosus]|uniref:Binding-protein-dependent transport systems inner membrane component n=2 Tax=Paenibacillus mucilaginosus TaxID=61624 RepID=H6NEI8_9BACL|nr:carbohydrate ABC transporter permease [Paenibacillus mucilaginosus]AEI42348.1 binding-protein-dependent transport systems inner membrane component [Paenibacillus mucilaginosus KNP414]AFC28131.1 binding-protein-dependent transport systems inner membrane component [Paenibacillus mucilaginosus 3016]MCG7214304.1 carbohydrate ABC transporter permease [Paenibacillus mucilaginosus]WDM28811.1 carbohydrate ABC transporter permease [Paenibacillus mucilaginosus]WFA16975.1 carbohydrate ABC transporter 
MNRALERTSAFDVLNYTLMTLLCVITLYPFLYLLAMSLSPADVSFTTLKIIPEKVTLDNFRQVLGYPNIRSGFLNSISRTAVGTLLSVVTTMAAAYVLSKPYFPHRRFWTQLILLTMFFSGGLIPTYLLIKDLGLTNNLGALVLPSMISAFQLLVTRNFLASLPAEPEESAKIDGANDIVILLKIVLPLSLPILVTLALWNMVSHWNSWFDSLLYMTDPSKEVLQVVMRRIVLDGQMDVMSTAIPEDRPHVSTETIKAATLMVTTLPIVAVYPLLQKYFVKGMLVGSVKG